MCYPHCFTARFPVWLLQLATCCIAIGPAAAETLNAETLSLRACVSAALLQNRQLQIERYQPEIARSILRTAYGYYDPVLTLEAYRDNATDTGGFDPADFSRDAVYEAESEVARVGISGALPTGLTYSIGGDYAHSTGSRNFLLFESYKADVGVELRQPLLKNFWIDAGRMTIRINRKNLDISDLGVAFLTMSIVNEAQQAYYELTFAHENLAVHHRLAAAKASLASGVRQRVQAGALPILEQRLAEAQWAKVQADLIEASNFVVLAANRVRAVMGLATTNWLNQPLIPQDPLRILPAFLDIQISTQTALARRADLAQLKQEVAKADIDLSYRRNQLFPALDLVAGYSRQGASTHQVFPPLVPQAALSGAFQEIERGLAPRDIVGLVLTVPLSRVAERARFAASKQLKAQALLRVVQQEEVVTREVADAMSAAQSSLARSAAAQLATNFAGLALQAEEQKLAIGKSTVFVVLQLQSDLAAAEVTEVRARADYCRALSRLRFAEATILDEAGIDLDIR